jgi:hypothetical protein
VTVTGVETDRDYRHAKVLLSSLGENEAAALADARIRLQATVARQVRLKWTPTLSFEADPAVAGGARVEEILRVIHEQGLGRADDDGSDGWADDPERGAADGGAADGGDGPRGTGAR